jgi:hypothetical protein
MKKLYTSPAVTVEELFKADILCDSTERGTDRSLLANTKKIDNINQTYKTIGDISQLL